MIKFLTAGNVDDGKSSLIGRLLYDSNSLFQDQIDEVKRSTDDSFDGELDFSLFLDGLMSERSQKITIDVAYRYFSHNGKKFVIADAPGHEEYTRNMAVAAANSDVIVILLDAKKGVKPQTLHHSYIANLFGIKKVIVAVNKMDLVNYDERVFAKIKSDYLQKIKDLAFEKVDFVPVSSINGENIVNSSKNMDWHKGKTIMDLLDEENDEESSPGELRLLVQNVQKHRNKRFYQAFVASGRVKEGQELKIYPSEKTVKVTKIIRSQKQVKSAVKGDSIAFELETDVDLERGGVVAAKKSQNLIFADQLNANLVWFGADLSKKDLLKREFLVKINHNYLQASIDLKNEDVISLNEIVDVDVNLSKKIAFDKFVNNKFTGSFLLIDPISNETLACGVVSDGLKSKNIDLSDENLDVFLQDLSLLIKKHFPRSDLSSERFLEKILL